MLRQFRRLLTPIDFSQYSIEAALQAYELVRDGGAELHLLHVVVPHHSLVPLPLVAGAEQARELAREASMVEQAEAGLARIKKDRMDNSPRVTTAAVVGQPVVKIREYATQNQVDLIVVSTHGRTGLEHLLIGSVTEKLVRTVSCSVLVVRAFRRPDADSRTAGN